MTNTITQVAGNTCFGGQQLRFKHFAETLNCEMHFSVYLPPQANDAGCPVIFWLSGLTCSDENFVQKAGAQRCAAEHGVILVAPDTSPRGETVPDDPEQSWDFGLGAGFYVNATQSPWAQHYQMYSYIVEELPQCLAALPVDLQRLSIMGHSMGGHGALTIALKNPQRYRSVSAFAPICAPTQCPWGEKALSHYLGEDRQHWLQYDSCELLKARQQPLFDHAILIDQGDADNFLTEQLKPELLQQACEASGQALNLRMQPGYDHSYFFIASFIGEHIAYHAKYLNR